ncbi:uncharacterized protein LOC126367774 [Pectinophora gossypiella]|uniref:uncharacterized protein LOC126367774 n=1 Tax=Pectinophora gossypiella TaxID=13191 RepID=UPI00214E2AD8|nr:uncharacterized protein LOC126367774 [Pectinophora gossypiella]
MEFKGFFVFVVVTAVICVRSAHALPRDNTVIKYEDIASHNNGIIEQKKSSSTDQPLGEEIKPPVSVENNGAPTKPAHGRVSCQFEEATETPECQEHCIPKGYSYGLCIGHKCSCI